MLKTCKLKLIAEKYVCTVKINSIVDCKFSVAISVEEHGGNSVRIRTEIGTVEIKEADNISADIIYNRAQIPQEAEEDSDDNNLSSDDDFLAEGEFLRNSFLVFRDHRVLLR